MENKKLLNELIEELEAINGTSYYNMRELRPDLDIRLAPTYSGCQCNACPYMKMNHTENVAEAIKSGKGLKIDYLSDSDIEKAYKPIARMMEYA